MNKLLYLIACLMMILPVNVVNAYRRIDDYYITKPRVEKAYDYKHRFYTPSPSCKETCYNCCASKLRFYVKAEFGKDFSKNFARHWSIGEASGTSAQASGPPDYVGGELTNRLMYGLAVGYIFNEHFRVNINWQNRSLRYFGNNGGVAPECTATSRNIQVQDIKSNSVFLNGYFDVADCPCMFSPYFTAGAGYVHNKSGDLSNTSTSTVNGATFSFTAPGKKTRGFAWNVGAGILSRLTTNLDFDVVYRYVTLGKTSANPTIGTNTDRTPVKPTPQTLRVHEITAGLIFKF